MESFHYTTIHGLNGTDGRLKNPGRPAPNLVIQDIILFKEAPRVARNALNEK